MKLLLKLFVIATVWMTLESVETSTNSPTTTPVPDPQTTLTPTIPTPQLTVWNVTDGNHTCIQAQLQVAFSVPIGGIEQTFSLSPESSLDGSSCSASNETQILVLSYESYVLSFIFASNSSKVYVRNVTLDYMAVPAIMDTFSNDAGLFAAGTGRSYMCKTPDVVHLGNATMNVFTIHIQAFEKEGENGFGTADVCDADEEMNDLIPIVVACALAGLIVIVLITYLVGRRQSRQKGYLSV